MRFSYRLFFRLFRLLPRGQQLATLRGHGCCLARRRDEGTAVLYALHDFYCEVHYDAANTLLRTHCFTGTAGLEPYIDGIELGELAVDEQ